MPTTAAESSEAQSTNGVSNQLSSLVPTFDPGVDDLLVYQQKVELVYAAWPKGRVTELVTRLILGCKGSAFAKLQLHQGELLDGTEKSVHRVVELLGGQWGKIPLEQQYQDAEKALFETSQKTDETNDSYLARSDVMWSRLLARKMSLEDLQAYIMLRGSLLTSDEKKKVILDSEVDGKLTVKRVTHAIRTLGASFFMDMTNQKKVNRTKIYDQTALHTETAGDTDEIEPICNAQDELTEEEFIEQLMEQGDSDALLVGDFELAAQDTIQEDQSLAIALTSYQQARHRLSERFRNRGFFPSKPFPGGAKGKFSSGKGFNKGKGLSNWNSRPKKTLQERIMQSTCRLCGQRGHWKAECPQRGQSQSSAASSTTGGSMAPTTTVISHDATMDSLPLEFLSLPEEFAETLDADQENTTKPSPCFASCVTQGTHRHRYVGRILGKSVECHRSMYSGIEHGCAHDRLCQHLRSDGAKSEHAKSCHQDSRPEPKCLKSHFATQHARSHFATDVKRTSNAKDPGPTHVNHSDDSQCILFATHGTWGVLDLGASKTVIGSNHVAELIDGLNDEVKKQVTRVKCQVTFKFGNEGTLQSEHALVIPIGPLKLKVAVVPGGTPFLVSVTLMRALRAIINCQAKTVSSHMFKHDIPLELTPRGLFLIDINAVALAARQMSGQSVLNSARKTETFATVENKDQPVMQNQPGVSDQKADTLTCQQPQPNDLTSFHAKPLDANVSSNLESQTPAGNPECEPVETIKTAEAATSDQVATKSVSFSSEIAAPTHVAEPAPEAAAATSGRCRVAGPVPLPTGGPSSPEGGFRQQTPRREVRSCMEGPIVGELHRNSLCPKPLHVPSVGHSVHRTDDRETRNERCTNQDDARQSERGEFTEPKASGSTTCHESQGQANGSQPIPDVPSRHHSFARHGRSRLGVEFSDIPAWVYGKPPTDTGSQLPSHADQTSSHGECIGPSDSASRRSGCGHESRMPGGLEHGLVSCDDVSEPGSQVHPEIQHLWKQVELIQKELELAVKHHRQVGRPFSLAEVFCSNQSPLTHQVLQQGQSAFRHGIEQGDLSTVEGRAKLFQKMIVHQPKNVWFSPVCEPWSSWSRFNESRSSQSQQEYLEKCMDMLYQVALGLVLYRFQIQHGRHFHWEQPSKSLMFSQPGISEIHQFTQACQFDLCEVGALVDPSNGKPIKKGMTILTTSPTLYQALHGRKCRQNHEHQPIEGSLKVNDHRMRRSTYTEVYPRKFARLIAKIITANSREWPFRWSHGMIALTCCDVAESVLVARSSPQAAAQKGRNNFPKSELIQPASRAEQVTKRRRLEGKQHVGPCLEDCQEILNRISKQTPRVGKVEITDDDVLQPLKQMFNDKIIISVISCRGTDRTIPPPAHVHAEEAPFRKTLMILRPSGQVAYEENWEKWNQLSHRQLIRPAHACKLNITMFAHERPIQPRPIDGVQSEPASASSSQSHVQPDMSQSVHHGTELEPHTDETQPADDQETGDSQEIPDTGPVPSQTMRFRSLPKWEQNQLTLMHRNLGHPSNERLAKALQSTGHRPEVVNAARELRCKVCAQQSPPKHQRPGHLKAMMDFNHKVYMDGISWTNHAGKSFHFYHLLDAGTNFHMAIIAPSRLTADAISIISQHWVSWAGAPSNLIVDAATEFNNEEFNGFTQRFNIQCSSISPEAHWQMGKIERHGKFLQEMLDKIDAEQPIGSYQDLQLALNQSTQAKNMLSVRHGYSPEIIVFGKQSRLPGSILSDESIPSHLSALQELETMSQDDFRQQLQMREMARKAYHVADNSDNLRRAILRRSCPDRGQYQQGQWVMIWRTQGIKNPGWIGPQRVIIQDSNHTVWSTQGGKLYRSAPEHVRRSLPDEGQPDGPELPTDLTSLQQQINRMSQLPSIAEDEPISIDQIATSPEHADDAPQERVRLESSVESIPQPDQEPDAVSQQSSQPLPDTSDSETQEIQQLLLCEESSAFDDLNHDVVFRCEFEVPTQNEEEWPDSDPWILLTTGAAKQRTEVQLSELSPQERSAFEDAKQAEINNWLHTQTVSKVLRDQIPAEQIMKCRWILTWKPLDGVNQDEIEYKSLRSHKPKARLVVLGYQDPQIEEIPRDSPTLSKTARMLILQTIATHSWQLLSFDIKAAFLQGKPQEGRIMGLEPVKELRKALSLSDHEIVKLNKSAYGLVDAPFLWYCTLTSELTALGMEVSPFDPCTFVLRCKEDPSQIAGILEIHVDDGIGGGNQQFHDVISQLEKKYPFGAKKVSSFTFTGIDLTQKEDNSIIMSQSTYVRKIKHIPIEPNRKTQMELEITEAERGLLRGLVGSLQYAAVNTRPDLANRLSQLQSSINKAKIEDLLEANKLLHEAKKYHDVTITIKPIPYKDFRFMAFSDASFASHRKPDSHAGMIIVGTHQQINNNVQCPISPISWGSKKIQKVVTSTLSAETTSLAAAIDQLAWLRLFWSWIHDSKVQWKNPKKALQKLEPAISVPTFNETNDVAITDCKSLYDLITRMAPPSCSEFRVQLVARAIKEALREGISVRWVHTGAQLADCLTKAMQCHFLRETLRLGSYRLHDEASTLKDRAQTRDRIRWLQQPSIGE